MNRSWFPELESDEPGSDKSLCTGRVLDLEPLIVLADFGPGVRLEDEKLRAERQALDQAGIAYHRLGAQRDPFCRGFHFYVRANRGGSCRCSLLSCRAAGIF